MIKPASGSQPLTGLMYTDILAYALPYVLIALMYRYSFPICTLTPIPGSAILLRFFRKPR